jgi:hypothetical protein
MSRNLRSALSNEGAAIGREVDDGNDEGEATWRRENVFGAMFSVFLFCF